MTDAAGWLKSANRIADEVFLPAALAVDAADRVPASHLDLLAAEGFYGVAAPGAVEPEDPALAGLMLEALAGGCLTTTFVWMQHHGAVIAAAHSDRPGIRETWLEPLSRGERRAGIAYGGVRPGPSPVRARKVPGGWSLSGESPWVTGWDMIDTVHVAARDDDGGEGGDVRWLLVDAVAGPTLRVQPLQLVAVNASRTVLLRFDGHVVPPERVTGTTPYQDWAASDASGLRLNGSLSLALVGRCCRLLAEREPGVAAGLEAELAAGRAELDAATVETMPAARAAASALAIRAAALLTAGVGARGILRDQHAQRLVREAAFLLVFGSRPAIRTALLRTLLP